MRLFSEFALIVGGGLLGSVFGAGFGAAVGALSPEFVEAIAHPRLVQSPERLGAAMGMVSGLFFGAAAMTAGRFLSAVRVWASTGRRDGATG